MSDFILFGSAWGSEKSSKLSLNELKIASVESISVPSRSNSITRLKA